MKLEKIKKVHETRNNEMLAWLGNSEDISIGTKASEALVSRLRIALSDVKGLYSNEIFHEKK